MKTSKNGATYLAISIRRLKYLGGLTSTPMIWMAYHIASHLFLKFA